MLCLQHLDDHTQLCDQYLGLGGDAIGLHSSPSSLFGMLETKTAL